MGNLRRRPPSEGLPPFRSASLLLPMLPRRSPRLRSPFAALLLLALGFAACTSVEEAPRSSREEQVPSPDVVPHTTRTRALELGAGPPPTEHWLDADAEQREKSRRKAWFQEIHRATPGIDWQLLEERNELDQIEKRNLLSQRRAAGPLVASPWVERGSENLAGRMHVAVRSTDGETLYAGSSLGGVWRGDLDGTNWTPIGDNLAGGAHWLAVTSGTNPSDPDAVLAATDGGRVHVSRDLGATWLPPTGLPSLNRVHRVLTASDGSETVFLVGRVGSGWYLYRSTDRLQSFQQIRSYGAFAGDVWMPRDGGGTLWFLGSGKVDTSTDYGATWTTVGSSMGGSGAELCGSEAGAPRLWAIFDKATRELHRSDDAGATWTYVRDVTDYWGSLNASITDVDTFAWGGVEVWRTTDAGALFSVVNNWWEYYGSEADRLHADIPGIDVLANPGGGETWYVATDGGLYESTDALDTVRNLSLEGLRVSQYYTTHTSSANPKHLLAGAQDQGYQRTDLDPAADKTTLDFEQLISGDYGHLTTGDGTHRYVFSTYPGFILAQVGETSPSLYQVSFPAGEQNAWLPPVVASTVAPKNFYFCATRLWRYRKDTGSNSWTSSLWSTYDFQGSSGEYVSAFQFSPADPDRAYAATNRGRLFWSDDRGITWNPSASTGPDAHYFYGTALEPSALDPDVVVVAGSGYGTDPVYRSTDGGQTFQPWSEGLPSTLVYCLAEAPDGSGDLFCGTETAAYRRQPGGIWEDLTANEAPVTIYWSVEALPHENTMRFGTYGRGIWDYQIDPQARCVAQNGEGTNANCFRCVELPVLGGTFEVVVDASAHPGATLTGFLVVERPAEGVFLPGGEVLVDLGSPRYYQTTAATSGGEDTFTLPVPNDPAAAGLLSYAQGYVLGGGYELCNRLEIVLGD